MILKNKKLLIYGCGKSGRAVIELAAKNGAKTFLYDDGVLTSDIPKSAVVVSDFAEAADGADEIILSPAIPFDLPAVEALRRKGKRVTGELEFAYSFCGSDIIAVTGTNGKTTTTLLIADIISRSGRRAEALGNIGTPFSEKVTELSGDDAAVLEVSSFQLESIKYFSPDIAVLLNITPDHLDRHKCFSDYVAAKARLFENQINRDYAVLNADDSVVSGLVPSIKSDVFYFSATKKVRGCYVEDGKIYFEDKGKIFIADVDECSLKGRFNIENVTAAVAACMLYKINPETIRAALKSFSAPEYRNTFLCNKCGKNFYNDSKGTNIAATRASVETMKGDTVLIMGGSDKGEIFTDFFKNIPENVIHIFVTGLNAPKIIESAVNSGFYNISYRKELKDCLRESVCIHAENVLFSPASASYDSYRDYRERGAAFSKLVEELK